MHFNHTNLCHQQKFKTYLLLHAVISIKESSMIVNDLLHLASFPHYSHMVRIVT